MSRTVTCNVWHPYPTYRWEYKQGADDWADVQDYPLYESGYDTKTLHLKEEAMEGDEARVRCAIYNPVGTVEYSDEVPIIVGALAWEQNLEAGVTKTVEEDSAPPSTVTSIRARMRTHKHRRALYADMPRPTEIGIDLLVIGSGAVTAKLTRGGQDVALFADVQAAEGENNLTLDVSGVTFTDTRSGPWVLDDDPYYFEFESNGVSKSIDFNVYPALDRVTYPNVREVRIADNGTVMMDGYPYVTNQGFVYKSQSDPGYWDDVQKMRDRFSDGYISAASSVAADQTIMENQMMRISSNGETSDKPATRVRAYRDTDTLFGHRLYDEPSNDTTPDTVFHTEAYNLAKVEDPYKPLFVVDNLYHTRTPSNVDDAIWRIEDGNGDPTGPFFADLCDGLWIDVYPVRDGISGREIDINAVTEMGRYFQDNTDHRRIWEDALLPNYGTTQIFSKDGSWNMPTEEQFRNMWAQSLLYNGGGSLWTPYQYNPEDPFHADDEWKTVRDCNYVAQNVREFSCAPERGPGDVTVTYTGVDPALDRFHWERRVADDGAEWFLFINTSSDLNTTDGSALHGVDIEVTVEFASGTGDQMIIIQGDGRHSVLPYNTLPIVGNSVTFTLKPCDPDWGYVFMRRGDDPYYQPTWVRPLGDYFGTIGGSLRMFCEFHHAETTRYTSRNYHRYYWRCRNWGTNDAWEVCSSRWPGSSFSSTTGFAEIPALTAADADLELQCRATVYGDGVAVEYTYGRLRVT